MTFANPHSGQLENLRINVSVFLRTFKLTALILENTLPPHDWMVMWLGFILARVFPLVWVCVCRVCVRRVCSSCRGVFLRFVFVEGVAVAARPLAACLHGRARGGEGPFAAARPSTRSYLMVSTLVVCV